MVLKKLMFLSFLIALPAIRAEVNQIDMDIIWMIEQGDTDSFRHELRRGLNPNAKLDDLTLLMIAAQLGRIEIVRDLLEQDGIDLHAKDREGNTALQLAIIFGHTEIEQLLRDAATPLKAHTVRAKACPRHQHRKSWSAKIGQFAHNAKDKVAGKYQKAKNYLTQKYQKAKDAAANALGKSKEYANTGYEKSKDVAAKGYEKTKDAVVRAYKKVRGAK